MKKLTNLITAFSAVMAIQATSMAKLLVTPTRIDLNNSNKVQALKLINESNEEVTYRIGYMYQNMNADGSYTKLTDEEIGKRSEIEKMVMYSPRQVTLEPKQTQTVRFALRRKEGTTGEINAHVLFKEMQKKSAVPQLAKKSEDGDFSIEIKPLFNIAIPVIVSDMNQNIKMMATITDVNINNTNKVVSLKLTIRESIRHMAALR
jgi:fimbrial chaperone protein